MWPIIRPHDRAALAALTPRVPCARADSRHWQVVCCAPLLILVSALAAQAQPSSKERFEALDKHSRVLTYTYSGGRYMAQEFRCRLFMPKPYDAKKTYPLIVWLHGGGDRGDNNLTHLKHVDVTLYREGWDAEYPFFVFALQCSDGNRQGRWIGPQDQEFAEMTTSLRKGDEMLSVAMEILDHLERTYPIDPNRITAVGISGGGAACWEILKRYPDRLAAIAPLGSGGAPSDDRGSLLNTPIWAFHAAADPSTPVAGIRQTVAELKAAGGVVHLTETDDKGHDCWTTAFADHDLRYWLLSQSRGSADPPPPGSYRPSAKAALFWPQLWPRAVPVAILALVAWACISQFRRVVKPIASAREPANAGLI